MKFKTLAAALTMVGAISLPMAAGAAPLLVNAEGSFDPFGGFDYTSGSAAFTTDFTGTAGSTFNLTYFGNAAAIRDTAGQNFDTSFLDTSANGVGLSGAGALFDYEYTVVARFKEEVVACSAQSCTFKILSGTFDIYYDESPDARASNGTGFQDGVLLLQGTIDPSAVNQLFNNATGGQADLTGQVTYTNSTYINPALGNTNITSTLQLGSAQTGFTRPSGFDANGNGVIGAGEGIAATNSGRTVVFQADANQRFEIQAVPEPGIALLSGLALGLAGLTSRRRRG